MEILNNITGLFGTETSIWNKVNVKNIKKHINYVIQEEANQVINPMLKGIYGLSTKNNLQCIIYIKSPDCLIKLKKNPMNW